MGTILTDYGAAAYDHEGHAGRVLTDGTVTGAWSAETDARATGELAPACSCGWVGTGRWRIPGDDPTAWSSDDLDDQVTAVWRSEHAVPVLTAAAEQARARLASRLRWLADQVEAGRTAHWVDCELTTMQAGLTELGEAPTGR